IPVASPTEAMEQLKKNSFHPSQQAIVETEDTITASTDSTAEVKVTSYDAKNIQIETSSGDDGLLVLSEIYYPDGWHVTIDDEPAKIYKTNFILRGLQVPAGNHTISMTFEPMCRIWGQRLASVGHIILLISGIGVIALLYRRSNVQFPYYSSQSFSGPGYTLSSSHVTIGFDYYF